jgi:hypothetical protein
MLLIAKGKECKMDLDLDPKCRQSIDNTVANPITYENLNHTNLITRIFILAKMVRSKLAKSTIKRAQRQGNNLVLVGIGAYPGFNSTTTYRQNPN